MKITGFWSKFIEIGNKPFKAEKLRYRLFFFLLLGFILVSYAMRGLCAPWSYGYFNFTMNWLEGGYIGRGLFGTLTQLVLGERLAYSYSVVTLLQYFFAWAMILYLVYMCYQLVMKHGNLFCGIIILIFSTSTFNMFYMAEIGFLDHVAFCLVAASLEICLRCKAKTAIIWCAIFASLSVIILSTAAFSCCPVIASMALIKLFHEEKKMTVKQLIKLVLSFVPTAVITVIITFFLPTNADAWNNYLNAIKHMPYFDQGMADYLTNCWFASVSIGGVSSWLYFEPAAFVYSAVFIVLTCWFLIFAAKESHRTVILYVVMALACMLCGYAEIYFATDFHRYYFNSVFAVFILSIFMMRLHHDKYMNIRQSVLAIILSVICIKPVFHYRLWIWNRQYNDFWFMALLKN